MTDETETTKMRGLPDAVQEMDLPWEPEQYDVGGCAVTLRDGTDVYPFEGQSVWLSPYTPMDLQEAGMGFAAGGERLAASFEKMREGLSRVVAYHDLIDPSTGEPFAQWWHDADVLGGAPSSLLFYVWSLVLTGEPPDARPKESTSGSRGTSTRRSTVRRSKS